MTIREVLAIIFDNFRVIKLITETFCMQSGRYLSKTIETAEQASGYVRFSEKKVGMFGFAYVQF